MLGSLSIPTSTWELELSDHTLSLKLGFASKRKHDPKGIVDFHLKKNHFKIRYTHEETPDEFIYKGVDTFSENMWREIHKIGIPSSRSCTVYSSQVSSDTMLVFQH